MSYEPAKLHVEGPYDQGDTLRGPETNLYLAESTQDSASTQTNAQDIPTFDDDETLLAPLEGNREFMARGKASGKRIHDELGLGNNYQEALVRWLIQFESLVQSEQGSGYLFTDDMRNEVYDPTDPPGVLFSDARWTYKAGEGVNAEWSLEGQLGEGMQETENRSAYIVGETFISGNHSTDKIELTDGSISINLGEVSQRRYERSLNLDVMNIVHDLDVPVVGLSKSGVKGLLMFDGRLTPEDVPSLETAAQQINDDLHGNQVYMFDALTGRRFSGAIKESSTEFEAGVPNIMEYRIEIRIGETTTS